MFPSKSLTFIWGLGSILSWLSLFPFGGDGNPHKICFTVPTPSQILERRHTLTLEPHLPTHTKSLRGTGQREPLPLFPEAVPPPQPWKHSHSDLQQPEMTLGAWNRLAHICHLLLICPEPFLINLRSCAHSRPHTAPQVFSGLKYLHQNLTSHGDLSYLLN